MVLRYRFSAFVSLADIGGKTKERKVTKLLLLPSRLCCGWQLYPNYDVCDDELFSTDRQVGPGLERGQLTICLLGCRLCYQCEDNQRKQSDKIRSQANVGLLEKVTN